MRNEDEVISSAGVTSGIDAVLYVISQQLGEAVAVKTAEEMNYPTEVWRQYFPVADSIRLRVA